MTFGSRIFYIAVSVLVLAPISGLMAVGVDMDGYFRNRMNFHYNLDLDRSQKPSMRNYTDVRFRLNPDFIITDRIRIKSSFNLLDAAFGDTPFRGLSYSNPARANHPLLNESSGGAPGKTIPAGNQTSWVNGGVAAPDAAVRTSDVTPVQMRRVWAELEFDFGMLKVGRMPYDFGLGILGNAGDGVNQEIGSTRDRIVFETGLGSYYLAPGIGWTYEGMLDQAADDSYEYFFVLGRKSETTEIALYISYLAQDGAKNVANNGSFATTNASTSYWVIDFFGRHQLPWFRLEGEAVLYAGDYLNYDLFAVNAVGRADFDWGEYSLLAEMGYSSATSDADINNGDLKSFAFNREYNVAYLVFEEALPGGQQVEGDGTPVAPHSGAVSNAVYARANAGWEVSDFFHPHVNVIVPFRPKDSGGAGGRFYGVEYDLITLWPIDDYVKAELTWAHFIPGSVYDNPSLSKAHSTFLIRGGIFVTF